MSGFGVRLEAPDVSGRQEVSGLTFEEAHRLAEVTGGRVVEYLEPAEALEVIARAMGAGEVRTGPVYVFPTLEAADRCKAVLDAVLPAGSTGEVCGHGLLMVSVPG